MLTVNDFLSLPYAETDRIVAWQATSAWRSGDFIARVRAWQAYLTTLAGNQFALYMPDGFECACALWGCWLAAKTVYLAGDNLAATCFSLTEVVDGFLGDFPADYQPLQLNAAWLNLPQKVIAPLALDFAAVVIYTSGSTGQPQAISKSVAQLAHEVVALEQSFGVLMGDADIIATVSHQHIYGLLFKILWPLAAKRAIIVEPIVFLEALVPFTRPCVLIASPAHLSRLNPAWIPAQALRAIFSSGAALSIEAKEAVTTQFQCSPIEVYGSSETGGIAWRQHTVFWQALPGVKWRINSHQVLEIQSAHLPDDAWFCSSDQARVCESGFELRGRVDRIVKLEGKRIALTAIERILQASHWVSAVRVLLLTQPRQRIAAFIVLTLEGQQLLVQQGKLAVNLALREVLKDQIEAIACPRTWCYLKALPVNTQGKTVVADLIALLPQRASRLPHISVIEQESLRVVLRLTIPHDLVYFNGHFTDLPVLPGVVQIDWAIHYGRQYFALPGAFSAMQALKFQRLIQPGMALELSLCYDIDKAQLNFRYQSHLGLHASGRLRFDKEAECASV